MPPSRRTVLGAGGAGLAALASSPAAADDTRSLLIKLSHDSNAALMRGDIPTYRSLLTFTDDFTLMSPFGGRPSHGQPLPQTIDAMGRFFRNGDFRQEIIETYVTDDLAVLVLIERSNVAVGDLPAQDWALRVTLAYRRENGQWRLAHRHADPIVAPMSVSQSAEVARGVRPPLKPGDGSLICNRGGGLRL